MIILKQQDAPKQTQQAHKQEVPKPTQHAPPQALKAQTPPPRAPPTPTQSTSPTPTPKPQPTTITPGQPQRYSTSGQGDTKPVTFTGQRTEYREKMSRLRQRVSERLKGSQNVYAILTTFNEVYK